MRYDALHGFVRRRGHGRELKVDRHDALVRPVGPRTDDAGRHPRKDASRGQNRRKKQHLEKSVTRTSCMNRALICGQRGRSVPGLAQATLHAAILAADPLELPRTGLVQSAPVCADALLDGCEGKVALEVGRFLVLWHRVGSRCRESCWAEIAKPPTHTSLTVTFSPPLPSQHVGSPAQLGWSISVRLCVLFCLCWGRLTLCRSLQCQDTLLRPAALSIDLLAERTQTPSSLPSGCPSSIGPDLARRVLLLHAVQIGPQDVESVGRTVERSTAADSTNDGPHPFLVRLPPS